MGVIKDPSKHNDPVILKKGLVMASKIRVFGLKKSAKHQRKPPKAKVVFDHPMKSTFYHSSQAAKLAVTGLLAQKQISQSKIPVKAIVTLRQLFLGVHALWIK